MSNTLGERLQLAVFGESHGPAVGVVVDGLPAGIPVSEESIRSLLAKRCPRGKGETARVEQDHFQIVSGVFESHTNGAPLTILIPNENVSSADYQRNLARPSHADYVAYEKYHGFEDYRGGGHFSGRVTAPIVAAGAIVLDALKASGIEISARIRECAGIEDDAVNQLKEEQHAHLQEADFPTLNLEKAKSMQESIEKIAKNGDSVGGELEVFIDGVPLGLGEPWFSSVEGKLSLAMFGVGGVKGISFGAGQEFKNGLGSELNDAFAVENGEIHTITNHNGGINGGISNGETIRFQLLVKPTPSIFKAQQSVRLDKKEAEVLELKGRHDPAIIRRVCPVVRALSAFVILDLLMMAKGEDALRK